MRFRLRFDTSLFLLIVAFLTSCGTSSNSSKSIPDVPEKEKPTSSLLKNEIPPDQLDAVVRAHYQGLGHMERYEYHDAATAFREVCERAPGWIPGSINLAIALLNDTGNQAEEAKKARGGGAPSTGSANFDEAFDLYWRDPDIAWWRTASMENATAG